MMMRRAKMVRTEKVVELSNGGAGAAVLLKEGSWGSVKQKGVKWRMADGVEGEKR
jgi:hypothetical protein